MLIAVLKPASAEDIVNLVQLRTAGASRLRCGAMAMLFWPSLKSMLEWSSTPVCLNSVRVINSGGRPAIEAGPGALWGAVLDTAYAQKLTPPVNVLFLPFGRRYNQYRRIWRDHRWREGFQVDHVLELQVVTGHGELVACSDERNSDLFNAVLAGMGQCGIIKNGHDAGAGTHSCVVLPC